MKNKLNIKAKKKEKLNPKFPNPTNYSNIKS